MIDEIKKHLGPTLCSFYVDYSFKAWSHYDVRVFKDVEDEEVCPTEGGTLVWQVGLTGEMP